MRPAVRGTPTGTAGTFVGGDGLYLPGSNTLIAPLTNTAGFGRISYDLTDAVTAHAQGSVARSVTSYDTQAKASILGFTFFSGNAFLQPSVQNQLGPNGSFTLFRFINDLGPIPTHEAVNSYLVNGGLEWDLGGGWSSMPITRTVTRSPSSGRPSSRSSASLPRSTRCRRRPMDRSSAA